jgi:hypothetical protein
VKSALLSDIGQVSKHAEQEIDRLQQVANAKVLAILADENLTDEEKRKKIENLEAQTRKALQDILDEQVLAEQRVTSFAAENNAVSLEADQKIAGLEKVLKAEQLKWFQSTLKHKDTVSL